MNLLSPEKETLMEEIEKSLWDLTEDNLSYLCEHRGIEGSEIKGMNRRLLRRKVMEEMWDNMESMKSQEQGLSWLLHLKRDIEATRDNVSSARESLNQNNYDDNNNNNNNDDCPVDSERLAGPPSRSLKAEHNSASQCNGDATERDTEESDWFPSIEPSRSLKAEHNSASQCNGDATECDTEESDWFPSIELEVELMSPSTTSNDDSDFEVSDKEDRDWMPSDDQEAESSPVMSRGEQRESDDILSPSIPKSQSLACSGLKKLGGASQLF
ncbi:hypothetical protein UPYG_G00055440 [Umbra pygmaea]|uniref:Uncharacterized protein n=1 Tax=Umbra pygmaea TaxID=75934 RepID=A0ABD0XVK5_UMBPY